MMARCVSSQILGNDFCSKKYRYTGFNFRNENFRNVWCLKDKSVECPKLASLARFFGYLKSKLVASTAWGRSTFAALKGSIRAEIGIPAEVLEKVLKFSTKRTNFTVSVKGGHSINFVFKKGWKQIKLRKKKQRQSFFSAYAYMPT